MSLATSDPADNHAKTASGHGLWQESFSFVSHLLKDTKPQPSEVALEKMHREARRVFVMVSHRKHKDCVWSGQVLLM